MKPNPEQIHVPRWAVQIPNWKELGLQQFHVEPTYFGVLEGTTDGINQMIIEEIPNRIGSLLCPERKGDVIPVHFAKPSAEAMKRPFPNFLCMATVTARPVQNETLTEDTLYSRAFCCWFTDDLNGNVGELIVAGIKPFPWDDCAENCEM